MNNRCAHSVSFNRQEGRSRKRSWLATTVQLLSDCTDTDVMNLDLKYKRTFSTPSERHVFYRQYALGYPVHNAWIRVDVDDISELMLGCHSRLYEASQIKRVKTRCDSRKRISEREAIGKSKQACAPGSRTEVLDTCLRIFPYGRSLRLAWKVTISLKSQNTMSWDCYVDAHSSQILSKDVRTACAEGYVFFPNPMVRLGNFSLRPNDPISDLAYSVAPLKNLDNSGFLRGKYVKTKGAAGSIHRTFGDYYFRSGQQSFRETMAYFFINYMQEYLNLLRFDTLNPGQVLVVVDGRSDNNSIIFLPWRRW